MNSTLVANIEQAQLKNFRQFHGRRSWKLVANVACWLRSEIKDKFIDVSLVVEAADETTCHQQTLDRCLAARYCDTLLSGKLELNLLGRLKRLSFTFSSENTLQNFVARDVKLKCEDLTFTAVFQPESKAGT